MNHSRLEFFKTIKEMIETGSTCSEILEEINRQPYEIKSLFPEMHLRTLKSGRDKVLKDQLHKGKLGGGSFEEAMKTHSPFKLNEFDYFDIFIKEFIEKFDKKESG